MLQQFRRAIGVAIVQGNAKYKLGHLHYVRESMEEAANASTAQYSRGGNSEIVKNNLLLFFVF
jgi:hypothetical protein